MLNETVSVIATVISQPDKVEDLKTILLKLVEPTRSENGCISYQLLQSKADPAKFVFIEEWASDSAIDVHMATSHVQEAFSKAQSLFAIAPDISKYVIIG